MEEQVKIEGYEDASLQALNPQRQTTIAHCPNVDELPFFLNFEYMVSNFWLLLTLFEILGFRI